eukprot:SAG11_NODE_20394_length_446_cov_0.896254_1_plen_93_part_10
MGTVVNSIEAVQFIRFFYKKKKEEEEEEEKEQFLLVFFFVFSDLPLFLTKFCRQTEPKPCTTASLRLLPQPAGGGGRGRTPGSPSRSGGTYHP